MLIKDTSHCLTIKRTSFNVCYRGLTLIHGGNFCRVDDIHVDTSFHPTFQKFIDKMKQKSYDDTGVNVTKDDHIMTLSTCSTTGKRFVVHAVRIGEHALEK